VAEAKAEAGGGLVSWLLVALVAQWRALVAFVSFEVNCWERTRGRTIDTTFVVAVAGFVSLLRLTCNYDYCIAFCLARCC